MPSRFLSASAAAVLVFAGSTAQAQGPADAEARDHFEVARQAYADGRFLQAAREFEISYELSARVGLLYNIHLAYRDANELDRAEDALRRYLELAGDVDNRAMLEARLAALERGESEHEGSDAPIRPSPTEDSPPVLAITLMAVGGAALIGGGITTALVLSDQSTLADACPTKRDCDPELEPTAERVRTTAYVTDVLFGVGLVSLGVGIALLVAGGADDEAAALSCGPFGCAARGRF